MGYMLDSARQHCNDEADAEDEDVTPDPKTRANCSAASQLELALLICTRSAEEALQTLWAAKTLHPELFGDIDVVQETQIFHAKFYHYNLGRDDAERMLRASPSRPTAPSQMPSTTDRSAPATPLAVVRPGARARGLW